MNFKTFHRDVLQLTSNSNPYGWPVSAGETKAFIAYIRFDDWDIGIAYGKSLVITHWAKEFEIRKAKRFASGYEVKLKGLSQVQLEILVHEFESKDWLNELFDAQYQAHCDRADLMADYYNSAWV